MSTADDRRRTAGLRVWAVRILLVVLAVVALWLSQIADARFRETVASAFRFDLREWSATVTPLILAGALFAIAARFPFLRPRYAWGRLALAAPVLALVLHSGFVVWAPQFTIRWPAFAITPRWFDGGSVPSACAVLAGIAIGAGFGARREAAEAEAEAS
ncbi:MAG: hypothetical protein ACXVP7_07490 [Actinomycetota bacterium]